MEKRSVITVRFASGAVEYWYEAAAPKVGDRVGRDASGFVTSVELDGEEHATVYVGTPAPDFVRWDDVASPRGKSPKRLTARERILDAAYELFSQRGIRAVGTEEVLERAGVARPDALQALPLEGGPRARVPPATRAAAGRGSSSRRRPDVAASSPESSSWRSSTSSTSGSIATTSRGARSSTSCSRSATSTIRSAAQARRISSTSARSSDASPRRPGSTTRRSSPSRGTSS